MSEENQSLIKVSPGLIPTLISGGLVISVMPREILVLETFVAGTSYSNVEDIESKLTTDTKLVLVREPKNEHDEFAIAIYFENNKIGYIPRDSNEVMARLLDAGKSFFATITKSEWEGNWLRVDIKVYMKD